MTHSIVTVSLASLVLLFSFGCEDATRSGNNLMCHSGSCSSSCDDVGTTQGCNVQCEPGSSCDARCNAGQPCNFMCQGDAVCRFDCTAGACQAEGGADCSCTGECTGTCGMSTPPGGGADGGTGGSCLEMCGDPSSPGYGACAAACG